MRHLRGTFVLVLLASGLQAQDGDGDVVARARRLLAGQDCQIELPADAAGAPADERVEPRPQRGRDEGATRSAPPGRSAWRLPMPGFSVAQPVFWLLVGLAVLFLVVVIVRSLRGSVAPAAVRERKLVASPQPAAAAEPELPDHARFAAAGDFAAAIHALLRHALLALGARLGGLPPHATGRDALRRARSGSLPVDDLAPLVRTVEIVHFGGQPAGADLYAASAAHLERWRRACGATK